MLIAFSQGDEVTRNQSNDGANVRGGIMSGLMEQPYRQVIVLCLCLISK